MAKYTEAEAKADAEVADKVSRTLRALLPDRYVCCVVLCSTQTGALLICSNTDDAGELRLLRAGIDSNTLQSFEVPLDS